MNAPTVALNKKSNSSQTEELKTPYKVYVGFEKDGQGGITGIEVIDGYLMNSECLALKTQRNLPNGVSYFEIEVIPNSQMNTYLRIPSVTPLQNNILVKVFKHGHFLGTQFIDKEGNIL
jgi:hypothetical protein